MGTVAKVGWNAREINMGNQVNENIIINCGTCYYCRHGDGLLCENFKQIERAHEKKCLEDTLKEIQEIKKLSKVIVSPETN